MKKAQWQLHEGENTELIRSLPPASIDTLITDPPYSSGGLHVASRQRSTGAKYEQSGQPLHRPDFAGDHLDQRSWTSWIAGLLRSCRPLLKKEGGGHAMLFTDWRQLPSLTDAVQHAGYIWRGVVAWDKGDGARAAGRGRFRHQCEYLVWASAWPLPKSEDATFGCLPGAYRFPVLQRDKHHQAGKPTDLMRQLVQVCPPGGTVLDLFAGSATTGVASLLEGRSFIGAEVVPAYAAIARQRLAEAERMAGGGPPLRAAA